MSTPEINQVLAQMRITSARASAGIAPQEAPKNEFGDLLKQSIDAVNATAKEAGSLRTRFEQGDEGLDLAQVMVAAQKSSVAFRAMVEVRNKLVEAYKDIKNMPV